MYCHGLNRQTIRHADFHRTHGLFSILASYFVKIVSRAQTHNFLDQETAMAAGPSLYWDAHEMKRIIAGP
jgi:hypothetical protein